MKAILVSYRHFTYDDYEHTVINSMPHYDKTEIKKNRTMSSVLMPLKIKHQNEIMDIENVHENQIIIWLHTSNDNIAHKSIKIMAGELDENEQFASFDENGVIEE